ARPTRRRLRADARRGGPAAPRGPRADGAGAGPFRPAPDAGADRRARRRRRVRPRAPRRLSAVGHVAARPQVSGSMSAIRIVVADDHQVVRHGLRLALELEPDMVVVGEARTGTEAVRAA